MLLVENFELISVNVFYVNVMTRYDMAQKIK